MSGGPEVQISLLYVDIDFDTYQSLGRPGPTSPCIESKRQPAHCSLQNQQIEFFLLKHSFKSVFKQIVFNSPIKISL